jgi:peptidoglycan/xylan/chitin deacetylase (PgdA/CDA1 family)
MPRTTVSSWKPAPAIKWSAALHAAAGAGVLIAPAAWPWALGALAADHLLLTAAGLWPRSTLLGPNLVRLPEAAAARGEVALTIDDGPDPEVTPQVLDMLDAAGAKASFFCIGRRARLHPGLCRELVARGHRVENHGDSHSKAFAAFGPKRLHAEIAAAQAALSEITGQAPRFFRPTAGLRSPLLDPVLSRLDLRLAAWTRRGFDTRERDAQRVYQRLASRLAPADILLLHDGHAARTTAGRPVIVEVLPRLLADIRQASLAAVTLAQAVP